MLVVWTIDFREGLARHKAEIASGCKRTLMMLETKLTTSGNLRMSTSKCFSSFLIALVVMTLDRSLTAAKFLRYPAGSSSGSGGFGRSIFGTCGAKGERGVFGAEVLFVPAELRFIARELNVPAGDLTLELPESRLTCDCTVVRDGLDVTPFVDLSFLEKIPMLAVWAE
jgi:hypothetical protein